jgi:hypothetical protein
MPSPRGTNHARLFLIANPRGAYDEALPGDNVAELLTFLRGKLSPADFTEFCRLGKFDEGITMDNGGPEPFAGMPRPGGGKFGQDSASRSVLDRIRANAARIGINR